MKKILIGILGVLTLVGAIAVGDGTAQSTFTISGRVIDSRQGIGGIGGVTMTGLPGNPITDSNGYYSGIVPSNWSGTIKPQKIGYAIFPFSTEYTTVAYDQNQNYTAVLLPKVALSMQPTTYNLGDPINITMTLQNQGNDFFTLQGFMATNFALFLQFTDPDNKLITSNFGVGRTPLPPAVVPITTQEDKVELLSVDYVENVPAGWVLSMPFNALNYYALSKGGNYLVKAKISVRAYPSDSVSETQTNPPSGIFFAPHDSGSSGDAESNTVSFTISEAPTVLHHISIYPLSTTIIAGGSQSYTAQGFDVDNKNLGDMTGATAFSISPNGNCTGNTCTATVGGAHTVIGNNSGKTATATLQVNPGTLNSITISPTSATITAGVSQGYTATGYDQYNNSLGNVTGATTFTIGPDGSCTGATCTATIPGPHTVTGNDNGKIATASLQVNAGGLHHITISPASATITVGGSQVYTATGYDQYGNSLGNVTSATTFTITPDGSCTGATCTPTIPGPHTVTANDGGKIATASLQVNAGGLHHITISPASATIIAGASQSYTAQSFDANNNSLGDVTGATIFSITPNGSCTGNTCTATVGGAHTVTGNDSGKTATASLQVIYNYSGFFSPIDNPPTVNAAKGGQAVPVKWRLTDASGVGISDPGSFTGLTSYQANCSEWGGMTDPIPEEASGASGLQYLGNGNWQYNWKTSKGYAGTCRVMVLTLKDGTQHTAEFKFK